MKTSFIASALVAGLLGISNLAAAQTTSMPAAPDPAVSGQASTKSPSGVPNPTQKPDGMAPMSRAGVKAEATMDNHNSANTMTPKGEASTMTNNQPNAPQPTGGMSRAEVKTNTVAMKPQMGQKGERPDVPTNSETKTGTPK